jgi:hypothetical protein
VALCQARTSTKPLWGLSSSNPYHPSHVPNIFKFQSEDFHIQGGSDKSGILQIFIKNCTDQLKIIRFH